MLPHPENIAGMSLITVIVRRKGFVFLWHSLRRMSFNYRSLSCTMVKVGGAQLGVAWSSIVMGFGISVTNNHCTACSMCPHLPSPVSMDDSWRWRRNEGTSGSVSRPGLHCTCECGITYMYFQETLGLWCIALVRTRSLLVYCLCLLWRPCEHNTLDI